MILHQVAHLFKFVLLLIVSAVAVPRQVFAAEHEAPPPVRLRIEWGGGEERLWTGRIEVLTTPSVQSPAGDNFINSQSVRHIDWCLLSEHADEALGLHREGAALVIQNKQPRDGGGLDLRISDWQSKRLRIWLRPMDAAPGETGVGIEGSLAAFLVDQSLHQLDGSGNRLTISAVAGDLLRMRFSPPVSPNGKWQAEQKARVDVHPLLPTRAAGYGNVELRLALKNIRTGEELQTQSQPLLPFAGGPTAEGIVLEEWQPVVFECGVPSVPGVYQFQLQAIEQGSLRWSRTLASATKEFVVSSNSMVSSVGGEESWQLVYELDPGSPRLHERLRRLPGQAAASMRRLSLPAMPMPSLGNAAGRMPSLSIPKVSMPGLPKVPSVDNLMPRFSGLLSAGHSTVEPHQLGAMLRLPPMSASGVPAWEGIVITDAIPGRPHAVEVAYPSDQHVAVGLSVLEQKSGDTLISVRHDGGFEVPRPPAGSSAVLRRHRFVFWPRTQSPLLVISNSSRHQTATVGRVTVHRGPAKMNDSALPVSGYGERRIFAPVPREATGAQAGGEGGAGEPAGWVHWYDELSQTAERLKSQHVTGLAVDVYAGGASLWQSDLTAGGPRWEGGAGDPSFDEENRLALLCRVNEQAGMGLVPTLRFDGIHPRIESLLGQVDCKPGLLCLGRDGEVRDPSETLVGRHYNILDPRVQGAVLDVVAELVERLRGSGVVDGIALELSAKGWLHLPGVAWGLDDTTFLRFVQETGKGKTVLHDSGPNRFTARAAAVEGELRSAWLAWRAEQIAMLHQGVARIVAAQEGWNYYIMPTTLMFAGSVAERMRPAVAGQARDQAILYELGLDPAALTRPKNAVFVAPRLHAVTENDIDAAAIATANQSASMSAWERRALRRGLVLLEQPKQVDITAVIPHGPFDASELSVPSVVHAVSGGAKRQESLLLGLATADAEVVFDQSLRWAELTASDAAIRQAFLSFPVRNLQPVDGVPDDFPVRFVQGNEAAWLLVGNASRMAAQVDLSLAAAATGVDVITNQTLSTVGNQLEIELMPWSLRVIRLAGSGTDMRPLSGIVHFEEDAVRSIEESVADLRQRQAVLETPPQIPVLDNPGFDLPSLGGCVTGWEVVEAAGGLLELIDAPSPAVGDGEKNQAIRMTSVGDLATVRSNPFQPPQTGRLSVAVWLRLPPSVPQPPLRIAVEGVQGSEQYYRFAPVGAAAGGRPLQEGWNRFVLQVTDLPSDPNESLRLRFDMLGPGVVEIDEIEVYDLVFNQEQQNQLHVLLNEMESELADGSTAKVLSRLEGYWPRFLQAAVSDEQAERVAKRIARREERRVKAEEEATEDEGFFDRARSWWR
ncbi:MAG: hypothetical protein ISQ10_08015 [Planctomycetes bacterium]|nr:hypothetical protein [Planctomycetota bacterium]